MLPPSGLSEGQKEQSSQLGQQLPDEDDVRSVPRMEVVQRLIASVTNYFPQFAEESGRKLRAIANEAYELADQTYGVAEAVKWANGFVVPLSAIVSDIAFLDRAGGCLVAMARNAREARQGTRLSAERIDRVLSSENPERDKLTVFGRNGVPVPFSKDFIPCGVEGRPKLRRKYTEAKWAVDKMIYEGSSAKGLAFILPLSRVATLPTRVHFSPLSWAPKQGKAKGRNICDTGDKGRKKEGGPSANCGK